MKSRYYEFQIKKFPILAGNCGNSSWSWCKCIGEGTFRRLPLHNKRLLEWKGVLSRDYFRGSIRAELVSSSLGITVGSDNSHWLKFKFLLLAGTSADSGKPVSDVETRIGELVLIFDLNLEFIDENWLIDVKCYQSDWSLFKLRDNCWRVATANNAAVLEN